MRRLRGTRYFPLALLATIIGVPALLCIASLIIYIILPFPHTDILVLGVDSRAGDGWVTRADSIMLVGIDPNRLQVTMMSIPRDLSINVPEYGLQRVNTVNMLGEMEAPGTGPALMQQGIKESFGIEAERYVRLDFNGFVQLIDAVGGVTVTVERQIIDYNYPTDDFGVMTVKFEPGTQQMDGKRALIYARTRYADDDYRRAERQQQVVAALMQKLINPVHWPAVIVTLNQSVDTNLNLWDMLTLAPPVILNAGGEQLVIDRDYITFVANDAAVPDYEKIAPWLDAYFD
jgi:LCP family protein required for cell wall assembly